MSRRAPAKIAGLTVFLCPRRPGNLVLTPSACATSHKMAQGAIEEAKIRLWDCIDCPKGAQHLAELATAKPGKADKGLPEQMANLLKFVKTRGRVTTNEAASHFARHRGPTHIHMMALERKGLVRRAVHDGAQLWEAAL